ncbi:DUF4395 domain-containing protein [Gryllotalpicola ginsengisoli]|uniref:DUF4395 domain-containing protein n=1 Tax=Gryllotalpicola ginsengisoli TaxID=444608 RepID=UPI0003B6A456|nr:DUF4395 domain-containing protein [Gryllotalpicola ginsengisoli]
MSQPDPHSKPDRAGIDPRGPRFSAGITAVLLALDLFLSLVGAQLAAWILLFAIAVLFAWGAVAGVQRHPYGWLYRRFVRPRLAAPAELEDPAPPAFAQLVGLVITGLGVLIGGLFPVVVAIAAALALVAAFLNSAFGFCLGCQLYLLLVRSGLLGRSGGAAA